MCSFSNSVLVMFIKFNLTCTIIMFTIIKFNLTCKTKLKYAYYELNYEYQDREYSSVSLDILVCNYLLHQAHKELNKRIESEVREDTSLEVMLSKYPYGMELRRCQRTA